MGQRLLSQAHGRLGLLMVVLIPLPAILLHARFEPLQMLAIIVVLTVGLGIVYPVWWRSRHHPYREDRREKRTRQMGVTCRTVAFISLVGFMVSWVVGSSVSSWIALTFLAVGAAFTRGALRPGCRKNEFLNA